MALNSMARNDSITALILTGSLLLSACNESDEAKSAGVPARNFVADVSGSVSGQISGPGLIRFLPPGNSSVGPRPGYFFLADDSGVRDLGITFTIPANTQPGTYELESAPPLETGEHFEVRVDRSVGNRTESFHSKTSGTITLEAFPQDGENIAGVQVKGQFEFSTQDKHGHEITLQGSLDFQGR